MGQELPNYFSKTSAVFLLRFRQHFPTFDFLILQYFHGNVYLEKSMKN